MNSFAVITDFPEKKEAGRRYVHACIRPLWQTVPARKKWSGVVEWDRTDSDSMHKCPFPWQSNFPNLEVSSHSILKARSALQVSVKAEQHVQDPLDVLHAEWLALVDSQRLCSADGVLDLATVEVVAGEGVEVFVLERRDFGAFENANALDEHAEDALLGFVGELTVAESDVDT